MGLARAETVQANPIRKIVTLLQNMQKEIEGEGAKEKELFDKFMCFCTGSDADLKKKAADATAAIEELTAKLKSEEAEKVQIGEELVAHKADREGAKADIAEATTLRAKKADSEYNIGAMAKAIPALEKGMGGAALIQMVGGDRLKKVIASSNHIDDSEYNIG